MRSFTGSGGAIFLLGEPVTDGTAEQRPEAHAATAEKWTLAFEDVIGAEALTLTGPSQQFKQGAKQITLDGVMSMVTLSPGDDLVVRLPFAGGHFEASAAVTEDLASKQDSGVLQITDPKEVLYVP